MPLLILFIMIQVAVCPEELSLHRLSPELYQECSIIVNWLDLQKAVKQWLKILLLGIPVGA